MAGLIERVVAKICIEMVNSKVIKKREYFVYKYNLQLICERTITLVPIIGISMLLHQGIGMILFIVSFAVLRKYTGGYHCKTFLGCFILSTISCLSTIPFVFIFEDYYMQFLILLFLSAALLIGIGSINNPYINWNISELVRAKTRSRISCLILLTITLVLSTHDLFRIYSIFLGMGLIQTSISLVLYRLLSKGGKKHETEAAKENSSNC